MVKQNHLILSQLRTQIERIDVRLFEYGRRYEWFRALPDCVDLVDRQLQLNITYLYHTTLSVLEERQNLLSDYIDDVRDVLADLEAVSETGKQVELRSQVFKESREEVKAAAAELIRLDRGIKAAMRNERELLAD